MFQLDFKPTYWWPVIVRMPDPAKPGEFAEHRFEVQLQWLDDKEHAALLADASARNLPDTDAMAPLVLGIRKIADASGKPLDSTPENIARVLAAHGTDVAKAYFASRNGRDGAAQKN
jgi:hypothetical protein